MAAVVLPAPGTEYGPCKDGCAHVDCALTRDMAASVCRFCHEPVGYEASIYRDPDNRDGWVHAVCLMIDRETKE